MGKRPAYFCQTVHCRKGYSVLATESQLQQTFLAWRFFVVANYLPFVRLEDFGPARIRNLQGHGMARTIEEIWVTIAVKVKKITRSYCPWSTLYAICFSFSSTTIISVFNLQRLPLVSWVLLSGLAVKTSLSIPVQQIVLVFFLSSTPYMPLTLCLSCLAILCNFVVMVSEEASLLGNKMANIVETVEGKVRKQTIFVATVEFAATAVADETRGFFPSSFLNLRGFATETSMVALVILFQLTLLFG